MIPQISKAVKAGLARVHRVRCGEARVRVPARAGCRAQASRTWWAGTTGTARTGAAAAARCPASARCRAPSAPTRRRRPRRPRRPRRAASPAAPRGPPPPAPTPRPTTSSSTSTSAPTATATPPDSPTVSDIYSYIGRRTTESRISVTEIYQEPRTIFKMIPFFQFRRTCCTRTSTCRTRTTAGRSPRPTRSRSARAPCASPTPPASSRCSVSKRSHRLPSL